MAADDCIDVLDKRWKGAKCQRSAVTRRAWSRLTGSGRELSAMHWLSSRGRRWH